MDRDFMKGTIQLKETPVYLSNKKYINNSYVFLMNKTYVLIQNHYVLKIMHI
jgi:hypothetical protein